MITRLEFYCCIIILFLIIFFSGYSINTSIADIQKAKIEAKDSILQVQRDSAISMALKLQFKADSAQGVINRKTLNYNKIQKQIDYEKKNVLILDADSTLSFFERTAAH